MTNPWKKIDLNDYENHMKSDYVKQLQELNTFMKLQLNDFPVKSAIIMGVAGGNGLEHIDVDKLNKVYAIDINENYLQNCKQRYGNFQNKLEYVCADLTEKDIKLPNVDLVIANLLIEYIGYERFKDNIQKISPTYISCVIQVNVDDGFVSQSPFIHAFDSLSCVHTDIEEQKLTQTLLSSNYSLIDKSEQNLPDGKKLVLLNYKLSK